MIEEQDKELFRQIADFPSDYKGSSSSSTIPVLQFLYGRPFDDYAKCFLLSLQPSSIVVNWNKLDARRWRVNVRVDDQNIIQYIEQEVEVLCLGDVENGHDLNNRVRLYEYKEELQEKFWFK